MRNCACLPQAGLREKKINLPVHCFGQDKNFFASLRLPTAGRPLREKNKFSCPPRRTGDYGNPFAPVIGRRAPLGTGVISTAP